MKHCYCYHNIFGISTMKSEQGRGHRQCDIVIYCNIPNEGSEQGLNPIPVNHQMNVLTT